MLSEKLAQYINKIEYKDIPEDVREFTKGCLLDYMGSAIAGSKYEAIQILASFIDDMGGHEQATTVTGGQTSVYQAAFINGGSSHIVELDDIHRGSIVHAATVVMPAAIAMAEYRGKSGKDLLTAIVVGYEIAFRIGEAVSPSHYRYWHNTATIGTFAAAAAAAKLADLSEEQIVHALGSAGTQAAGLWQFIEDGAMTKQLHPAKAGMDGIIAVLTAEKGLTAASKILEGKQGFFQAMSEQADQTKITDGLGHTFKIMENSFKIHASCRHTHQPIDLVLELKDEGISSEDVRQINIKTYQSALDVANHTHPQTIYAAKFSITYCTAVAFIKSSAGLKDFTLENIKDPEISQFMERIQVEVDPDIEAQYPEKWMSRIEVELTNGEKIHRHVDFPKGDPENPVSAQDLTEKFKTLASPFEAEKNIDQWLHKVWHLEELEMIKPWFNN